MYSHALVLFDSNFPYDLIKITSPFRLPKSSSSEVTEQGIQFASGLHYNGLSDELIITYGVADCSGSIAKVLSPFAKLKWYLMNESLKMNTNVNYQPQHNLVRIVGPIKSAFSLSVVNRYLADAVLSCRYELTLRHSSWGEKLDSLYHHPKFGHLHDYVEENHTQAFRYAHITVYNDWPPILSGPISGKWVWNLAWEFTSIPLSWYHAIRHLKPRIWVPTSFVFNTLVRAGITASSIKIVPHVVDVSEICGENIQSKLQIQLNRNNSRVSKAWNICQQFNAKYIYLYHGGALYRKGLDILLEMFVVKQSLFRNTCLIVHTMYGDAAVFKIIQDTAENHQNKMNGAILVTIRAELSAVSVAELFFRSDAIIHPSRGEGFGLVAAQALACGKTLISSAEGGTTDFANEETAIMVAGKYIPCQLPPCVNNTLFGNELTNVATWFEPDANSLMQAMKVAAKEDPTIIKKRVAGLKIMKQYSQIRLNAILKEELANLYL